MSWLNLTETAATVSWVKLLIVLNDLSQEKSYKQEPTESKELELTDFIKNN